MADYCKDCGKGLSFSGKLRGTLNLCPHCLHEENMRCEEQYLRVRFRDDKILLAVTQSRLVYDIFLPQANIVKERALKLRTPNLLVPDTITEIPYEQIHSIKKLSGLIWSSLKIVLGVFGNIEINGLSHADAEAVLRLVHEQLNVKKEKPGLPATESFSAADELRKLAGPRDAGILTSDEFENEKQRLLNRR